jgi:hypothetical protein
VTEGDQYLKELKAQRDKASVARLAWKKEEDRLTAAILMTMGYSTDPKDRAETKHVPNVLSVVVTPIVRIDQTYFKETYPAIYAECQRTSYAKKITNA